MLPMFAVAQYTPPNYTESNADGTNTIYSTTGDYGDLYDLTRSDLTGVTGCTYGQFSDDGGCNIRMEFGFSWEWHNDSYTAAVMSTNGCLKLVKEDYAIGNWTSLMCYDYTPNQLGSGEEGYTKHATDILFPFYTDLIGVSGANSALLYKAFDDYAIFGWYNLREYNRASENSFEVYIFDYNDSSTKCGDSNQNRIACSDAERAEVNKPDNYGFVYGALDIIQHDVLIGEQKSNTNYTQYLFYDDGTDNLGDGSVDNSFDDMDGGYLENGGGILYSDADGEPVQCQSNPLYSTDCLLYDLAYLEYQCNLDSQYDSACEFYEGNEVDQGLMCDIDPLYDPSCPGYDAAILATSSSGYDPTTGLVTDPNTGEQYNTDGSTYDDGYAYDDGGVNQDMGDEPWMVNGVYDPRLDPNISYDDLNTEQQMLVDQGLSPQDAMFVTMGQEHILALGEDPIAVQFNGHRPGDYVLDAVGGLENYDTQLHDTAMQQQSLEWDPNGNIDMLTADVWATEEFQQEATEQLEGMVETYGEEFYSFTDQDWYEHDVATYGQEEVDQWHENIEFDEEGQINWDTFVEGAPEEEVWIAQDDELMPDYTEEEIFVESDEAFEELISEAELEELTAEESPEEIREEEVIEEQELIVEAQEEQEEVREEIAQEEVRVEKEAEQAVSSSGSSSKSRPAYQSVAIAQIASAVSDDAQTANVIEDVISDGGASASVQVDSGASQSFAGQDGSSFNNTGSQSVASSSSSDSTGVVADDSNQQQFEQVTGQVDTSIDVASTSVDVAQTSAFEVAEQQQEMMQEEQLFIENFDDGTGGISSTDVQFEDNLTEALATGTGLTEFLSQQAPNFQRFEVQNSVQEQRTTEAVESLADSVGSAVAQQNLEAQLQNIQDGEPTDDGGYADQTIAVAYIGYTAGFSAYTGEQVYSQGNAGFFDAKQMPDGKIDDNKMGFYRMAGNTQEKLYKMVLMQYGIQPDEDTGEQ